MGFFMFNLLIVCCILIKNGSTKQIPPDERNERKLNTGKYARVLPMVAPLEPTESYIDSTKQKMERNQNCKMVYMDKQCTAENGGANHLRDELMSDISKCFKISKINSQINEHNDDFFIFVDRKNAKCNTDVDMNAFCISKIENEFIMIWDAISVQPITVEWNLERIDEANDFELNFGDFYNNYHYDDLQHDMLDIYILDGTVLLSHNEFSHIPSSQRIYMSDPTKKYGPNYHGTHVAGTVVGNTVGLIRDPSIYLYSYGVCGNNGRCSGSRISSGLTAIINNIAIRSTRRAVINFSVGGGYTDWFDPYFQDLTDLNAIFVTSAGNSNRDACSQSPAHHPQVISVGAYDINDHRSSFSNYGPCIDAFGPGSNIYSSHSDSNNAYTYLSGTSMSSPAISGLIGLLLLENNGLTFSEIKDILSCDLYGFMIEDNQSPIQHGFGAPFGDYYYIANNPNLCVSLADSNSIHFGESVSGSISIDGEEQFYRVSITEGTTNIAFNQIAGNSPTTISFYTINYYPIDSDIESLQIPSITNDAYWVGISGTVGSYTVEMNQNLSPTHPTTSQPTRNPTTSNPTSNPTTGTPTTTSPTGACLGLGERFCNQNPCCSGFVCRGNRCTTQTNSFPFNSINNPGNSVNNRPPINANNNNPFKSSSEEGFMAAQMLNKVNIDNSNNNKHDYVINVEIVSGRTNKFLLFGVVTLFGAFGIYVWFCRQK